MTYRLQWIKWIDFAHFPFLFFVRSAATPIFVPHGFEKKSRGVNPLNPLNPLTLIKSLILLIFSWCVQCIKVDYSGLLRVLTAENFPNGCGTLRKPECAAKVSAAMLLRPLSSFCLKRRWRPFFRLISSTAGNPCQLKPRSTFNLSEKPAASERATHGWQTHEAVSTSQEKSQSMSSSMTEATEAKVFPIGKHKGKPVELVMADREYVQWITAQPWLREKFAPIYNILVQGPSEEQECTPEHNAMQNLFLLERHPHADRLMEMVITPVRPGLHQSWTGTQVGEACSWRRQRTFNESGFETCRMRRLGCSA